MEMKIVSKLKLLTPKILNILLLILISITLPVSAEFYQSGLVDFIQGKHLITVPILSPAETINIKGGADTILLAAGADEFELEAGQEYYITQGEVKLKQPELKNGWGVQIMASSSEENALDFKNQAEIDFEEQIIVKKEAELFKVLAGAFTEREGAEEFQQQLQQAGYNGWLREIELQSEQDDAASQKVEDVITASESGSDEIGEGLNFYNSEGEKLREAHIFKIKGQFEAEGEKMKGEFQFGPIGNSVLFSYKTDLEELTAHLLQNSFNPGAPLEALKAQAVLYRTALLFQLETQGARLEKMDALNFNKISPIFKEAAAAANQVLVRNDEFYYNSDFSFKQISRPRAGIIPLAQAEYSYQEIINYYYDRAELANLTELLDSEVKYTARINRGLNFKEIRQMSWSGPRVITVVDYDLKVDELKLKPVLAQDVVPGREDLGDIIRNNSALAGVNGGYFHYSGRPLGLLYLDGMLVSEPLYNRTALLIDREQNLSFAQVNWKGEFKVTELSRSFNLNGANRSGSPAEAVVYNSYYGARMPALSEGYYDIVVRGAEILGIETKTGIETPIPPDGYIIRVGSEKNEIINLIPELKGKTVELKNSFSPSFKDQDILHAIGGAPRLLAAGEVAITGEEEKFQPDILNGRAPRTALGLTEDNHLLMLTIDGRQSTLSIGMTLEETAKILKELGAVEAMNLDGGASARMVIRGFTMNSPSADRLISNGVIVNKKN